MSTDAKKQQVDAQLGVPGSPIRVLIADDDASIRSLLAEYLSKDPRFEVVGETGDGLETVDRSYDLEPHVIVMDVTMPHMDGCEATERILADHPDIRVVAYTGAVGVESVMRMVLAGAVGYAVKSQPLEHLTEVIITVARQGYFVDPSAVDELFTSVVKLAREERRRRAQAEKLADELTRAYRGTIGALVNALRSRDNDTEAHGDRVADRVLAVGRKLGLNAKQLSDLEYGAIFHDIGKIAMPDSILHNEDDLTDDEWAMVRRHTVIGEEILRPVSFLANVATIVRHSHENYDGSGYPDGLAGDEIPIESRIVFACDAFDAMTSTRTYQRAMTFDQAIARMNQLRGTHFDPKVVDAFIKVVNEGS